MNMFVLTICTYLTFIVHELLYITVDSHVTLPVCATITLVLTADVRDDATSALKKDISLQCMDYNNTSERLHK